MAITFECACGKTLRARDELAGKKARCTQCGEIFFIPQPEAEMVVVPAVFDDEEEDDSPYGVLAPEPRAAIPPPTATAAPARSVATGSSTYHPSPREKTTTTRFAPSVGSGTASVPKPGKPGTKKASARPGGQATILEYSYVLLALALIPLVFSLLRQGKDLDLQERFTQTIEQAPAADQERMKTELAQDSVDLEQALAAMPGNKLVGAHLTRDTAVHWLYAGLATAGFLGLLALCFSVERAHPVHLLGVGLFTATAGILFLLLVQFCAMIRLGSFRARGVGLIILMIMWFIGWSYESANDPETGFLLSAFGFTFGVGLCEEFTKAIPMFFWFRRYSEVGWRGACLWGLASGVGFGVAEGIMYASRYYNGIHGAEIYLVRFVSCVALHAMWAGSVGIAIARHVDDYEGVQDATGFGLFALRVMIVPMVLHGLYDTLLKKDMNAWALLIAGLSFAWFAWHIELARRERPAGGRPKVKRSAMAY